MVGFGYKQKGLVFCEDFLVVSDGVWLLSVEDLDGLEPVHYSSDLLLWKMLEIFDLFQYILTPFLLASASSTISTFQSTSP